LPAAVTSNRKFSPMRATAVAALVNTGAVLGPGVNRTALDASPVPASLRA
jgi:hypothetical protein